MIDRRATWRYSALGTGFKPGCPELRRREKPKLFQIRESREAMRIWDDSVPWDDLGETPENRDASRNWFDALKWPDSRLAKVEKQEEMKTIQCLEMALYQSRESRMKKKSREVSRKNSTVVPLCVCTFQPLLLLYFSGNKKNKKRCRLYFYTSALLLSFFLVYNNYKLLKTI